MRCYRAASAAAKMGDHQIDVIHRVSKQLGGYIMYGQGRICFDLAIFGRNAPLAFIKKVVV